MFYQMQAKCHTGQLGSQPPARLSAGKLSREAEFQRPVAQVFTLEPCDLYTHSSITGAEEIQP